MLCIFVNLYYSKTSLTRTSGDRPKTSVLTEVRVSRKLKKIKPKNRASAISSLSFVSTDDKPPQCCLFLPVSVSLIITFLV